MTHSTTADFWRLYNALPEDVRRLADKNFDLLQADSTHPSLYLKEIDGVWSVRVGRSYRALGYREGEEFVWFWIGSHADYDKLLP